MLLPGFCAAQITITTADFPQAGDDWGLHNDTDGGALFAITPGGSWAQTWNYATAFDNLNEFGLTWEAANSVIGGNLYPETDLGIDYGGNATFYSTDATGLYNAGAYIPLSGFTDTEHISNGLILPVPFSYGNTRTYQQVAMAITVFDDGEPATRSVRRSGGTFVSDAFGTMMTPSYPSGTQVLLIELTRGATVDSTFIDLSGTGNGPWTYSSVEQQPGSVSHVFVRNGQPTLVADVASGGLSATYYSATLPDAIAELPFGVRQITAYPVPTSDDVVHLPLTDRRAGSVEVMNALGEVVKRINTSGADVVHLHTRSFAVGTYQFRYLGTDGSWWAKAASW